MKHIFSFVTLSFLVALTCISCKQKDISDEKLIIEANNNYVKAILDGDLDSLMTFYAEDALLMPPDGDIIKGKESIASYWAEGLTHSTVIEAVSKFDEIIVFDDWAYSRGKWIGKSQSLNEDTIQLEELYFSGLWKLESNDSWKIARDMWHVLDRE